MHTSRSTLFFALPLVVALVFVVALAACGGGGGKGAPGVSTTIPGGNVGTGGGGTGTGGGGAGGGGTPVGLTGGVLATLTSAGQTFRIWITDPNLAQAFVDAWAGTGTPITTICAYVALDDGEANHNAPWSWSINAGLGINLMPLCVGCAWAWQTPGQVEAGVQAGPPYNCNDVNAGATWGMCRMQVALAALDDLR